MYKTNLLSSVYTVYISIHLLNIETCVRISNNQPIGNSQPYILYCALKGIQWEGAIYATLKFSQIRPNSGGPGSPVAWIPSKHLYKQPQSGTVSSQCHGKAVGKRSVRFIVGHLPSQLTRFRLTAYQKADIRLLDSLLPAGSPRTNKWKFCEISWRPQLSMV